MKTKLIFLIVLGAILCILIYIFTPDFDFISPKNVELSLVKKIEVANEVVDIKPHVRQVVKKEHMEYKEVDEQELNERVYRMKNQECREFYGNFYQGKTSSGNGEVIHDILLLAEDGESFKSDNYLFQSVKEDLQYRRGKGENVALILLEQTSSDYQLNFNEEFVDFDLKIYSNLEQMNTCFSDDHRFTKRLRNSKFHKKFRRKIMATIDGIYALIDSRLDEVVDNKDKAAIRNKIKIMAYLIAGYEKRLLQIINLKSKRYTYSSIEMELRKIEGSLDSINSILQEYREEEKITVKKTHIWSLIKRNRMLRFKLEEAKAH